MSFELGGSGPGIWGSEPPLNKQDSAHHVKIMAWREAGEIRGRKLKLYKGGLLRQISRLAFQ